MVIKPQQLGKNSLPKEELINDRKNCRKFGPCGIGKQAMYLNSFYIDRKYYIPIPSVKRVFKRIAMSKGGFTGKGVFATLSYLVVQYEDGKEKQCNFKHEEDVDRFLAYVEANYPEIPVHSKEAEKKLEEKEKRLQEKLRTQKASEKAKKNILKLEAAKKYLYHKSELYLDLSQAAKKKRVYDKSNSTYKWVALAIMILGAGAFGYGIYAVMTKAGFGVYFILFGLAAIFLFSGVSVLPTAHNNRKYIERHLIQAVEAMEHYIKNSPDFPVPAYYAHPIVLKRMEDIMREGRAETMEDALEILKEDLKALNSNVMVEQEEYDEVVAIKPMFLVRDYQ